ncbi:hypothetical protein CVT26_009464 [Gymnopilus dilepis]|uniref:Tyr recombinase domain-containing protein n=1 Tax=Gymnopilus dilepis TaxID=231916 RepID=A0A409YI95_9AGAR|nr:hypothetical protein CVT26_009464 [Gymnopilus dilepis]
MEQQTTSLQPSGGKCHSDPTTRFFGKVQPQARLSRPAPCAWDGIPTTSRTVKQQLCGMAQSSIVGGTTRCALSIQKRSSSVQTGRDQQDAPAQPTTIVTYAQGAETGGMEHRAVPKHSGLPAVSTEYKPDAWEHQLALHGILEDFKELPDALRWGFDAGIPAIGHTYTPPNSPSAMQYGEELQRIIDDELGKGRYFGPFSAREVEALLGPFQTSPLSIIPKPGKPGKFRLIQNLSYPHTPHLGGMVSSINSAINSAHFPCTWGTFAVVCGTILDLPPGSQAAVRDVKEAYRTVPIRPEQWAGMVVRLPGDDTFGIDTRDCFGLASGSGVYGRVGDAGAELVRATGMGPVSKWVDDHVFFRILRPFLAEFNAKRRRQATQIAKAGGRQQIKSRVLYFGEPLATGKLREFDEDHKFPIRDLSGSSSRSTEDAAFTYCLADIDTLSDELGIKWETTKDVPFGQQFPYIGFLWDLEYNTVSLLPEKTEKYRAAIKEWREAPAHPLEDAQKLYGKLLHTCHIIPAGRAYLTNLERFMGVFGDSPFMPRTPPRGTDADLEWWDRKLSQPALNRIIPGLQPIIDCAAYSDASSETGIGITIGNRWRAWRLLPGWKSQDRDIGWAEARENLSQVLTSKFLETIRASSKGGGRDAAETPQQMKSSKQSMVSQKTEGSPFIQPTFQQMKTQQTTPQEEGTIIPHFSYQQYPSQTTSGNLSQTSTQSLPPQSCGSFAPTTPQYLAQSVQLLRGMQVDRSSIEPANKRRKTTPSRNPGLPRSRFNTPLGTAARSTGRPAPYADDLRPRPSDLRPHVLARDRLRLWRPLSARNTLDNNGVPTNLGDQDLDRIKEVLEGAWEEGTREGYGSGLLVFHVFCDQKSVPEEQRAPASKVLIMSFIATIAGAYSGKTISNYVQGVRAWHILHGVPWEMEEAEVSTLLTAAEKATPARSRRKKRTPYTPDFMVAIRSRLQLDDPLHAAVYACLTTTFYAAARVKEFTVPRLNAFNPEKHVKPSDVRIETDRNGFKSTVFHIPSTKAAQVEGEDVSWSAQDGVTDPEAALAHHMAVNDPPQDGALFAYRSGAAGARKPLTKAKFIEVLARAARGACLDPRQGHGIRIGATLEYLLRGVPFEVMKVKGRWASEAFRSYLTKHAQILAPYMQAHPQLHAEFLRITMPPPR